MVISAQLLRICNEIEVCVTCETSSKPMHACLHPIGFRDLTDHGPGCPCPECSKQQDIQTRPRFELNKYSTKIDCMPKIEWAMPSRSRPGRLLAPFVYSSQACTLNTSVTDRSSPTPLRRYTVTGDEMAISSEELTRQGKRIISPFTSLKSR
jgi:hypothetical protein